MTSQNFKTQLKEIKEELKGKTLRICTSNSMKPFKTLKDFGNEVLKIEKTGLEFFLSGVFVEDHRGMIEVESFEELKAILDQFQVTCISFDAKRVAKTKSEYITKVFGTAA